MDLINVPNDKVRVEIKPPKINSDTIVYHFASIIPGTYAVADYGRFIEDIRAYTHQGKALPVQLRDSNTVVIANAKELGRLSYLVNDTFDAESGADVFGSKEKVIFSPSGTNILEGKQFWINWCGFVGYFNGLQELPYRIAIQHPIDLFAATAASDNDTSATSDRFSFKRFAEAVDNPVMYSKPDTAMFRVNDMDVLLSVYAPHGNVSAMQLKPDLQKMIIAQKTFLGKLNTTKKYAVLAYLTTSADGDAKGIGALEHNNSTTAVFRESMTSQDLINVISHEFFHTVTPLKVHSEEIRYFDFEHPKMSRHLWFYEGVTEYFANLFQVNQGLISENKFYDLMTAKIKASLDYNDALSFTTMSKNVLQDSMKREYPNVYQKGALIAMCMDILLREHSAGKKGILSLMGELVAKYGADQPFKDEEFIQTISEMTFPAVAAFLKLHVVGGEPIDYATYLKRMGLSQSTVPVAEPIVFVSNDQLYINIDEDKKQVVVAQPDDQNKFFTNLGLKDKDVLLRMNGLQFNAEDGSSALMLGYGLKEGAPVSIEVLRDGKKIIRNGTVKLNYTEEPGFRFSDQSKLQLKHSWLKN
ncbi:peptidase M61 [Pedobacter foliorum]|uniref:M61 family metallopeptidase n=1 Tax=Pedobacter foliorum TaxID=2739058 RepID=UPI00156383E0|nr:peptidase M61 [Pedobacter foliorum]NRF37465.1 peptidase M61 [Pedobacter foliorum]